QDAAVRAHAAQAVWKIGGQAEPVLPTLMVLLQQVQPEDRQLAAYILGNMRQAAKSALPGLQAALLTEVGTSRLHVAEAIAKIAPHDSRGIDTVAQLLRADATDSETRWLAAMVLRDLASQDADRVAREMTAIVNDPDPRVRAVAASTLNDLGTA